MATAKFIKPYVEHGEKANAVRKITVSIPLHVLRRLSDLRTHRQVNNLRHATNSDCWLRRSCTLLLGNHCQLMRS
jgi:MetJ family methionine regulon transcriptional repressor